MHLSEAQGLARLYQTASTAMRQLSPRPTRWPRTLGVGWPRRVGGGWPGQGCASGSSPWGIFPTRVQGSVSARRTASASSWARAARPV